jgi:hypothetical protein
MEEVLEIILNQIHPLKFPTVSARAICAFAFIDEIFPIPLLHTDSNLRFLALLYSKRIISGSKNDPGRCFFYFCFLQFENIFIDVLFFYIAFVSIKSRFQLEG